MKYLFRMTEDEYNLDEILGLGHYLRTYFENFALCNLYIVDTNIHNNNEENKIQQL